MCERVQAELIAFGGSLVIGSFLTFWPGIAQRFDESMPRFFQEHPDACCFHSGFGIILLCCLRLATCGVG